MSHVQSPPALSVGWAKRLVTSLLPFSPFSQFLLECPSYKVTVWSVDIGPLLCTLVKAALLIRMSPPTMITPTNCDQSPAIQCFITSVTCTYYSAVSSPLYSTTTNTGSTLSSNMSFPYLVIWINSRKSRKTVLYPRRAHPLPPLVQVLVSLRPPVSVSSCLGAAILTRHCLRCRLTRRPPADDAHVPAHK